jgi:hypothetical protein
MLGKRSPSATPRIGVAVQVGLAVAMVCSAERAFALDKQGSAHDGDIEGPKTGFGFSGSAALGISPYNPTYAARPDNSGKALLRYALHADVDLIGRRLSLPIDVNFFSDRLRRGALVLTPSEFDLIAGVTSTFRAGPGALETGVRVETDRPVDRSGLAQTYVDARARYLFSAAAVAPAVARGLHGGDVTGWATLGVFMVNPSYAARPDNSGKALLRYALHVETSFWDGHAALGLDGTLFTDRHTNAIRPSELDLTPEIIGRLEPFELHLAYEIDTPVDGLGTRPGYTQAFLYALAVWAFDATPDDEVESPPLVPRAPPTGDAALPEASPR